MPTASYRNREIARAENTLVVEGHHYFPRDAVRSEFLRETERTFEDPKGTGVYLDVVVDGQREKNGAWTFPNPAVERSDLRGCIGFSKAVGVHEQNPPG